MQDAVRGAFQESTGDIEELLIMQLTQGLRGDDEFLPDYSQVSVNVYGKPPGPMRLYETGDFYEGIKAEAGHDEVTIIGTDEKTAELEMRYGDEIIKMSDRSKEILKEEVLREKIAIKLREAWRNY